MQYPADDLEFSEYPIDRVTQQEDGTFVISANGWSLWCGKESTVVPMVGQVARQYGRGIGAPVRGLFIDGQMVWYRNAREDQEHFEIEMYGSDAKDWLSRWDEGRGVWSIEMGGIGPGYEQAIQVTVAEMVRWFIGNRCDVAKWSESESWKADRDRMDEELLEKAGVVRNLGLSGAQWGAALSLASCIYREGPRKVLTNDQVKDRLIQVTYLSRSGNARSPQNGQ